MATSESASPGSPGRLKFKCVFWDHCPLYKRAKQDQSFIFSPETMAFAPRSLSDRLLTIQGVDGAYLRPVPNFYLHNFISFVKWGNELVPPDFQKQAFDSLNKNKFSWENVIPIRYLEFLNADMSLAENMLTLTGGGSARANTIGTHQMWVADASLYSPFNILPSEYYSVESISLDYLRVAKSFCTKWSYRAENVGQSIGATLVEKSSGETVSAITKLNNNTIYIPSTDGIYAPGDPVQFMKDNNVENEFKVIDNTYKNINPGMHWRMLKRTPVFQGEDFSIEFSSKAFSSMSIGSKDSNFRMLDKFEFLDVFAKNENDLVCGSINENGLYDKEKNQQITENNKKIFDFSRQVYYMIEIGVGDPDHNYWIIIAENSYPMFCHVGKVANLSCSVQQQNTESPPATSRDDEGLPACLTPPESKAGQSSREDTENPSLKEVTVAKIAKKPTLRKLSVYKGSSSSELLKEEKLKINVRQHAGSIVITFSGKENEPWIISRKDIDPARTPISDDFGLETIPLSESQINYKTVQMLIPFGQIAIMGGNKKCGFSFAPMIYNNLFEYIMPQSFSVQGPVSANDVEFLLSEKGKSLDPEVSVNLKGYQYANEAGSYTEIKKGKKEKDPVESVKTWAIDVQRESVRSFGKAPDMMKNEDAKKNNVFESNIVLNASECAAPQGSTSDNSVLMQVSLSVLAGDYLFPAIDGGDPWPLLNCVTPIIYSFRMHATADGQIFNKTPIDVSHHVLSFSDEWSETDWQKLEHSGSISFLISDGMKFQNNQSNYLYSLVDKTFYLQVSMWWEGGIMKTPTDPRDRVVFTGLCHGGTITTETNKKVLDCSIIDYSKILKDQFFLNSPFFDRMRDVNAIRDILQLSGLRDGGDNDSSFDPGSLIRILAENESKGGWYTFFFNGDKIYDREFALPGSYDMLQSPSFLKFADGSSYWDAITKISQVSNKVAFFDRLGVFHFNPLPYDQEIWGGQSGSHTNWTIQDWAQLSKVDFFATPKQLETGGGGCADLNRQIVGDYRVERVVQDVMNEIKVITTTPNGEVLVAGHTNYASLNDPDSPGFLGYRKPYLQMDGIFGSEETVKWVVKNYTRMFIPPIKVSFKAIGRNDIKALDVITFQPLGSREKQPLVIVSVKSEVDASKGTWFQDFECLWLFPRQDVQWGSTNEIGLGLDGSISGVP